jgi:ubiquinone/menaquinone biosynthesis C-methylase UbiE
VLDLGSGAGFDCLLAARQVGPEGRVVGVDMTPAMIEKARANAREVGAANVEFRLGEIEHLPVPDACTDVVISNCVVNLSPEKSQVYREAFRVLRPGGRVAISDVVATQPLPPQVAADLAAHAGCIAGATPVEELRSILTLAGFCDVRVVVRPESRVFIRDWIPGSGAEAYVASATIEATKP